jgi:hypothetical protein
MCNIQIQPRRHLPHPNINCPRKAVLTLLLKDLLSYHFFSAIALSLPFFNPSTLSYTKTAIITVLNCLCHNFHLKLHLTLMKLLSIAGHVLSFFPFLTHQNLMYQFFLIFFLKQICVIVTPTPYLADDNAGLQHIFDAIRDEEGSARSPVVPTSPYSGDVNLPPPAVSGTYTQHSSFISCS